MSDRWLYGWGLGSVALGGASLVVPLYVVQLGGSAYTLGILAASAAFIGVPGALLVGPFAERSGRHREIVVGGLALISLMLIAMPFVERLRLIVLLNALIWFGFAAVIPILTLLVVTGVAETEWSDRIALLNKFQGIGWAIGLIVGAVVSLLIAVARPAITGQRILLLVYAALALAGTTVSARALPSTDESLPGTQSRRVRRALRQAARFDIRTVTYPFTPSKMDIRDLRPHRFIDRFTPRLAVYFLSLFLSFAGFAAFFAPLPAFLSEFALSDGEIFAFYVISSVAAACCFDWVGKVSGSAGALPVQALGLGVRGIALPVAAIVVVMFGAGTLGFSLGALVFAIIGVTWALIIVTAGTLVAQLSPPTIRGESLGVYSALMAFAGGVGSILGGRLALVGYPVAFGVAGGLVGAAALLVVYLYHRGPPAAAPLSQPVA